MKKILLATILVLSSLCQNLVAQSPNAQSATAKIDASLLQTRAERGQTNGYTPLGTYVAPISGPQPLIDPKYLFPDFDAASNNTIWVKQGSTFAPLGGVSVVGGNITTNNVFTGQIDTNVFGVKIATGAYPLLLRAGSGNKVMVENGQSIGGANSDRSNYDWFINTTGGFKLLGGEFGGALDLNSFNVSEVGTIAGSAMTLNFGTPGVASSSGNITMTAPGGAGVVVPSTASSGNSTFALNPTSADAMYGRKDLTNTWGQVQTFSASPVVPDTSFSIAKTTGLQTALDLALKKDGSNAATANLNIGGYKISNLGNPTVSSDAVTLGYLSSNYTQGGITSVTAGGGTPLTIGTASGVVTLTMPAATALLSGYLTSSDWALFNGKEDSFSAVAPLFLTAGELSMSLADEATPGYVSAADFLRFNRASAGTSWTDGQLMIGQTSSGAAVKTTLTGSTNISVTNGPGSITLAWTPSGIAGSKASALLNANTSQTNLATGSVTSMYSYTVPANSLAAGDIITVKITGNLILETNPQTVTISFSVGGTTVTSLTFPGAGFSYSASEVPYVLTVIMHVRTIGASGTAVYSAHMQSGSQCIVAQSGSTTLNTTVSRLLNVLMQISAITGSNHISVESGATRLN